MADIWNCFCNEWLGYRCSIYTCNENGFLLSKTWQYYFQIESFYVTLSGDSFNEETLVCSLRAKTFAPQAVMGSIPYLITCGLFALVAQDAFGRTT